MRRCSATQRNLSAFSRHDTPLPVRRIVAGFPFLLFTASKQQILPKCSVLVERDRSCASRVKAPDQDYKNPSAAGEAKPRRTTPAVSETQRTVSLTGYRPLYFYSRFRTAEETVQRPPAGGFFKPDSVRVLSLLRKNRQSGAAQRRLRFIRTARWRDSGRPCRAEGRRSSFRRFRSGAR